jgi:hypothetical protein
MPVHKWPVDTETSSPVLRSIAEDGEAANDNETSVRPIDYLFGQADDAPATLPAAADRAIRYERGSIVCAIDGPVGTLRQMVIEEEAAEVKALVIRVSATDESVLAPPELVDRCIGNTILLNVTKEQFAKGASRSPRFDPRMFTRADSGTVSTMIPVAFRGDKQRSIVEISDDALQTGEVLERFNARHDPPTARRWWKRVGRSR